MKKCCFILLLCAVVTSGWAQRYASTGLRTSSILEKSTPAYLGSVEMSGSFGIHHAGLQVLTSHGTQFNPNFYIGGGFGVFGLFPYNGSSYYDRSYGNKSICVPIFVDVRPSFGNSVPMYLDLKFGGAFGSELGAYLDLSYGFMVMNKRNAAMSVFFGYQLAPASSATIRDGGKDFYGQVSSEKKIYNYSNSIRLGLAVYFGKGINKLK
ncbi:MAG: hypothetical protein MSS84_07665 [Bacteroidales bacterium]|nr:hypothetical protein [Bacteroidales bacterium]